MGQDEERAFSIAPSQDDIQLYILDTLGGLAAMAQGAGDFILAAELKAIVARRSEHALSADATATPRLVDGA